MKKYIFPLIVLTLLASAALAASSFPDGWCPWEVSHTELHPVKIGDTVLWHTTIINPCDGWAELTITYDWPGDTPTMESTLYMPPGGIYPLQASYIVNESTKQFPKWQMTATMMGEIDGQIQDGEIALGGRLTVK